jgi:hypothetical protein
VAKSHRSFFPGSIGSVGAAMDVTAGKLIQEELHERPRRSLARHKTASPVMLIEIHRSML